MSVWHGLDPCLIADLSRRDEVVETAHAKMDDNRSGSGVLEIPSVHAIEWRNKGTIGR